jgi:mannose-1-phosphate guanylyltransferase
MNSSVPDSLWAVVLAGGIGARFWPASTPARPKQLLPLAGELPLIRETVDRILPLVGLDRLRILAGGQLAGAILDAVPALGPTQYMAEPRARGTAPVLAWAAAEIVRRDPHAVMISLHADHVIAPAHAFRQLLAGVARIAAARRLLFTVGVEPSRPETGYGYIRVGERIDTDAADDTADDAAGPAAGAPVQAARVAEFVEKPDRDRAEQYLGSGGFLWNSGIFVWRAADLLAGLERHTPELAGLLPLLAEGRAAEFFDQAPGLSIDEGLLERSDRVAVARANFSWDDVGAWDAVGRNRPVDAAGNVAVGDAHLVDAERCIAWAEDGAVVVFGGSDLVVVRTAGVTFVAPRDRTPDLKRLLDRLPKRLRELNG